eukprot:2840142-Pyramimonas_sp.AAC.1
MDCIYNQQFDPCMDWAACASSLSRTWACSQLPEHRLFPAGFSRVARWLAIMPIGSLRGVPHESRSTVENWSITSAQVALRLTCGV